MSKKYVEFDNVVREYHSGEIYVKAAAGISFTLEKSKFSIIVGPSGAGKTTVLNILGGMDRVTSGTVTVDSCVISKLNSKELTKYRRHDIGFVFQFYNLIPNLTALENVELSLQISRNATDPLEVLAMVGLKERLNHFPAQLSGGEQQRVAIARALAKQPKLLLCDEPTGALDYQTGKSVLQVLQDNCRLNNVTVVLITHNNALCAMADRIIKIKSGLVEDIIDNDQPLPISQIEW